MRHRARRQLLLALPALISQLGVICPARAGVEIGSRGEGGSVPRNVLGQSSCDHSLVSLRSVRELALRYSERRALEWQSRQKCFSCHTVLPAVLSSERIHPDIMASVDQRLANWDSNRVWYPEQAQASRSTELIMSLLAKAKAGQPIEPRFFQTLMQLQEGDGAWAWLDYDLHPWESDRGRVYGGTLAAIALVRSGAIHEASLQPMVSKLKAFLRAKAEQANSFLWEQMAVLWAEAEGAEVLGGEKSAALARKLVAIQHEDGGWSMNALGDWTKRGDRPVSSGSSSDGYASAFTLYVIKRWMASPEFAALPQATRDGTRAAFNRGVDWLLAHQATSGTWPSASVNRDNNFNHGLIEDAAAGFGAMVIAERIAEIPQR